MCNLSAFLTGDVIEYALAFADVPTLRSLKSVSLAWRARARRILCARLCARVGLSLTSHLFEVTEVNLSDSRAACRLFADAADASRGLPKLAKVTGLGGFYVDVAALRRVESPDGLEEDEDGPPPYPMAGVRACIHGEGEAPMEVVLAACTLRDGEARVPPYAFRGDRSMRSIELPAGLTSVGERAFYRCSSMTSITLPAGLTSIGELAFFGCSSLTSITLPSGLTSLSAYAFYGCRSLRSIVLPAGITEVDENALSGCPCTSKWRVVCRVFRSCDGVSDTESDTDDESDSVSVIVRE